MPHIINVSRLTRKLRAIWGLRGEDYPTDAEQVAGYIGLEMDRPEWMFAGGEIPFAWNVLFGVVAGQVGTLSLFNPATSGVLLIAEKFASSVTEFSIQLLNADTALAAGALSARDTRAGDPVTGAISAGLIARANTSAGVPINQPIWRQAGPGQVDLEVVIAPGAGIVLQSMALATATALSMVGRIRPQEAGKLS